MKPLNAGEKGVSQNKKGQKRTPEAKNAGLPNSPSGSNCNDQPNSISQPNQAWGGRFSVAPHSAVADYTDSERYDRALYAQDIRASKAHARMLGKQGIIGQEEARKLIDGLEHVREEIASGTFTWRSNLEDLHMNIEARLTEIVGEVGKKLHTGRSRNDQVGLSFRLFVADALIKWQAAALALCQALCQKAAEKQDQIMPGFTHLQPAQPISVAQHLLAYAWAFRRDIGRIEDSLSRTRISPLGAAALAGTTYPLDPFFVAEEVGFVGVYANSMDAVSDRDFVLEALFDASVLMQHLSRLCEDIILWANPAFGFVRLPDAFATGSSIMPQKKNPDVAELMRGKTGRVYGALMALLTTMKALPMTYNRDMQEDKEGFLDANRTVLDSLTIMAAMLLELEFNHKKMRAACRTGFLNATELADYLVEKGLPFRKAHHIAGQAVALCEKENKGLEELSLEQFKALHPSIENDVFPVLEYENAVRRRETWGGTGPNSVARQLADFSSWFAANTKNSPNIEQ